MIVEGFLDVGRGEKSGFERDGKFLHKKAHHEREWNRGQRSPRKEKPKHFQSLGFKAKGYFVKKWLLSKGANPRGMLMGNSKEGVSITMKWDIIPRIALNPNRGVGLLR
jgi:hypothetical protein